MGKVFFFGAGASKACGSLLTSELLPALGNPESFGIDVARSRHDQIPLGFAHNRFLASEFIDGLEIVNYSDSVAILNRVFNELATAFAAKQTTASLIALKIIYNAFAEAFQILLSPAYSPHLDFTPYFDFFEWAKRQPCWITVLTTNWDQIAQDMAAVFYSSDIIDFGTVDLPSDALVPAAMSMTLEAGRYASVYQLNGSAAWLYCELHDEFYGQWLQPPLNLTLMRQHQTALLAEHLSGPNADTPPPRTLFSGNCPKCGKSLKVRLYVPGMSRQMFASLPRMRKYAVQAVEFCDELVFAGFSCPPEDSDLMVELSQGLRRNRLYSVGRMKPLVIQNSGSHGAETKARYEKLLSCEVEYKDCGFAAWAASLNAPSSSTGGPAA